MKASRLCGSPDSSDIAFAGGCPSPAVLGFGDASQRSVWEHFDGYDHSFVMRAFVSWSRRWTGDTRWSRRWNCGTLSLSWNNATLRAIGGGQACQKMAIALPSPTNADVHRDMRTGRAWSCHADEVVRTGRAWSFHLGKLVAAMLYRANNFEPNALHNANT